MSRGKKGIITQHTMCVKMDMDNWHWLNDQPNKNRAINQAIFYYKTKQLNLEL